MIGAVATGAKRWCRRSNTIGCLVSGQAAMGKSLPRYMDTFCSFLRDSGIFLANQFIFASRLNVSRKKSKDSFSRKRFVFFFLFCPLRNHLRWWPLVLHAFKSSSGHSAHKAVFRVACYEITEWMQIKYQPPLCFAIGKPVIINPSVVYFSSDWVESPQAWEFLWLFCQNRSNIRHFQACVT